VQSIGGQWLEEEEDLRSCDYTFPSPLMFLRAVDVSPVYNIGLLTIYDKVISSLSQDRLNYDLHSANISLRNIAS